MDMVKKDYSMAIDYLAIRYVVTYGFKPTLLYILIICTLEYNNMYKCLSILIHLILIIKYFVRSY
jgi:hypothetical protein